MYLQMQLRDPFPDLRYEACNAITLLARTEEFNSGTYSIIGYVLLYLLLLYFLLVFIIKLFIKCLVYNFLSIIKTENIYLLIRLFRCVDLGVDCVLLFLFS